MIRDGRDDDSTGVIALIAACWSEHEDCVLLVDAEAPELRAPASHVAGQGGVMFVAGDMDGFVMAAPTGPGAWSISRLYVAPAHRGTGLAGQLLDRVEQRAAGAHTLLLHSDSRFAHAHAFYENHSFTRRHPAHVLDDVSQSVDLLYGKPLGTLAVEVLDTAGAHSAARPLAELLVACVATGASVSYRAPLARDVARAFWHDVADRVAAGKLVLLAAWVDGRIAGTAMIDLAMSENQPHRADIKKVLVDPALHRRGIARALMARVEAEAWSRGRELLVLDTLTGSAADHLYRALGWHEAGVVPGYTRNGAGQSEDTTVFYRART